MSILIGADFVPTQSNEELFMEAKIDELLGTELKNIFWDADFRIFNLEGPFTDEKLPIRKIGPNLGQKKATIATYKALNVNLFTLANNHIMDQGENGLFSTLSTLNEAGIHYIGAGKNLSEAAKPFFFSFQEKKIGVFACAEHEFSIVGKDRCGANPIDLLETPDLVRSIREKCDYLIVLYHGGKERYRYPSPNLQKVCRKLAEKGADLVLVQHTHCVGCMEEFAGSTIVYGQGNFLFDNRSDECCNTGLLVSIEDDFRIRFFPTEKENHVQRLSGNTEILDGFYKRSEEIKKAGVVNERFSEFAENNKNQYLSRFLKMDGFFDKVFNKLTKNRHKERKVTRTYTIQKQTELLGLIRCEAHREVIIQALEDSIDKSKL